MIFRVHPGAPLIPFEITAPYVCPGSGIIIQCQQDAADGTYVSTILTPAHLFKRTNDLDPHEIKVDVHAGGGKLYEGQLLIYDFYLNLAAVTIRSDSPLQPAILRHVSDVDDDSNQQLQSDGKRRFKLQRHSHLNLFKLQSGTNLIIAQRSCVDPYQILPSTSVVFSTSCGSTMHLKELMSLKYSRGQCVRGGAIINYNGEVIGMCFSSASFLPINLVSRWWDHYKNYGMSEVKKKENKGINFHWTEPMSRLLLETLVEEANLGNKPSNTFKPASFVRVADLASEKFATECSTKHVINHLRTIGGIWKTITTIRGKSGFGWDDNLKMITCSKESYNEEIAAHHKHAKFLNKKIEMFDKMAIVVGKDMATGSFAKSFNDIELEASNEIHSAKDGQDNDVEELTTGKEVSSIGTSSKTRSHRKRPREDGETSIEVLAGQIGEMTNAIKKLSDDKVNTQELYKEVMKSEGFDEEFLSCVFDYLNANHSLAQGFMVKSPHLRKKWIERYMTNEWKGY